MQKALALCICLLLAIGSAQGQKGKPPKQVAPEPFVLGVVEKLYSNVLEENRVLNIYLPEGYKQGDTTTYPVTYLLDGSADEDFIHIVGLYQFNSFSWINRVPKSIVVGIATVDRRRDLTFPTQVEKARAAYPTAGHSDKFIAFIKNELQPFIEQKYRGVGRRTIIGQSLGGLLATQILFQQPALFHQYIIVSPSLWWNNGSLLEDTTATVASGVLKHTAVYIGVGKEGVTPGTPPRVMEVDANLLAEKVKSVKGEKISVHFDYLPEEDHGTILHVAVFNALRMLYPPPTTNQ
jgi:predicted alpha/beta superfamily hydrolase